MTARGHGQHYRDCLLLSQIRNVSVKKILRPVFSRLYVVNKASSFSDLSLAGSSRKGTIKTVGSVRANKMNTQQVLFFLLLTYES